MIWFLQTFGPVLFTLLFLFSMIGLGLWLAVRECNDIHNPPY